jgi:copper chaperone NosL
MSRALITALVIAFFFGCAAGPVPPAALDLHGGDACATCRMTISQRQTGAQIVSAADEPLFFDDIGCLREHLRAHGLPQNARIYVADHRTGEWTPAETAVYSRVASVETPMGSSLLAWASDESRVKDASAARGEPVSAQAITGAAGDLR